MNIYALLKKPFFGRYQKPWRWPQQVDRTGWVPIQFDNGRGTRLAGLYGPATSEAKGNVVCAHPMGTDAKGFFLKQGHADMLRSHGYNVLLFDFNGFGESENGDFLYPLDVIAAGRELRARAPGLPLGVIGLSFGAAWLLCALAEEGHGFQAAVAESAFTTLEEFWRRYPVAYAVLMVTSKLMPRLAVRLRPVVRIGAVSGVNSLLLIHGDRDQVTPPEMGERFAAACALPPERRSLWIAPGGEHTKSRAAGPEAYDERVLRCLDEGLGLAPGARQVS